jgi:hypothetical protein
MVVKMTQEASSLGMHVGPYKCRRGSQGRKRLACHTAGNDMPQCLKKATRVSVPDGIIHKARPGRKIVVVESQVWLPRKPTT